MSIGKPADPPQRLGSIAGLAGLLEKYHVDTKALFSEFEIPATVEISDTRAPFPKVAALLERAAKLAGCPHLGLELGSLSDHRILGPVGDLMSCAPNLEKALRDYIRYQMAYSKAAAVYLWRIGDDVGFGYGVYHRTGGGRQIYDLVTALGCSFLRALTNDAVRPVEIHLSIAAPRDVGPYRKLLPAPVVFDQGHTCLVIRRRDLQAAIPTRQDAERERLKTMLDASLGHDLKDIVARVRHMLRPALLAGRCGIDAIADELAIHPRTLSRRLASAGLTFEELRDEVRLAVACELLELTNLPVGAIGDALSYASHSAFVHAFKRWTGVPPSDWRHDLRSPS
ncbi:MAG: AraC family transcriptional regulator ligand-binding domain-containing protein [Beijerinckiaceae bacterium]